MPHCMRKACFTKLKKAATYLVTATNELRDPVCHRFVKLDLVLDCYVIANNYTFCNLIRAFRSGSYPARFDKKSRSEHQTLFLALRAGRVWAREYVVSSPDPTYERGYGDIRLIPRASLTFWREYLSPVSMTMFIFGVHAVSNCFIHKLA